jgi:hypothetical protein
MPEDRFSDFSRSIGLTTTANHRQLGKSGGRDRDRTCDPLIKSQLLYQLSYAPTFLARRWCRPEAMAAYNHGRDRAQVLFEPSCEKNEYRLDSIL